MLASTKNRSVMDVTDTFSACWRGELWRETRSPSIEIGLEESNADRFDHAPKQFFSGSSGHADKGPRQGAYRFEVKGIPPLQLSHDQLCPGGKLSLEGVTA